MNPTFNVVCGDFNGDVGNLGGPRSNRKPTKQGRIVSKFFNEFSLFPANLMRTAKCPLNTFKGGMGSSTIDFTAVPEGLKINLSKCEVLKDNIVNTSDHYAVSAEFALQSLPSMISGPEPKGRVKWRKPNTQLRYRDLIQKEINSLITEYNLNLCPNEEVYQVIEKLVKCLNKASDKLPRVKLKRNIKPFWNSDLTELKKEKVTCYTQWKNAGRPKDPDNLLYQDHKRARKSFLNALKRLQKAYEKNEVMEVIRTASSDKNAFWKKVKKARSTKQHEVFAVRIKEGEVVYNINEVVQVWRDHFEKISLPRQSENFDNDHFIHVTNSVRDWYNENDLDEFLAGIFSVYEIRNGFKTLKKGKAVGCDGLTTEHFVHAGEDVMKLITDIINCELIRLEYIPDNFRRGTQIPLYKGKNLCPLDVNNYRGITLLTCMNKLFEVLVWERITDWWEETGIISKLQRACRQGASCIHSALILKESIATSLDTRKKVFVAYFDAAKAFDSVWTDGLFYQLHTMGITGRLWRLLFKIYIDFKCKVRLLDTYSEWYNIILRHSSGGNSLPSEVCRFH